MREKKEINIQIGERIKAAREKAGYTQERFAEQIDVSPQYISDLERGVVGISVPTLKRLCVCLSVSSDQILFGMVNEVNNLSFAEVLRKLTEEQRAILMEIIQKYVQAIETERYK